jgi:ParB family chromosome partitioning protein
LGECEAVIERGLDTFIEVGNALLEIRDRRLYKELYLTFEDYCKERWRFSRIHAHRLIDAAEVSTNLLPIGNIMPSTESQARPLTQLDPEQQREAWQKVTESEDKITASRVQAEVDKILKPHVAQATGNSEWYTPLVYIEAARQVMGRIDIDPASSDKANQIVKANAYYTPADDGRAKAWNGNVWLNPPYAQPLVSQFCELLVDKYQSGEIQQACVLVNNATETGFYQRMLQHCEAVCFIKGRVKFIDEKGVESGAPLQGQTVLYFGQQTDRFAHTFNRFGVILYAASQG